MAENMVGFILQWSMEADRTLSGQHGDSCRKRDLSRILVNTKMVLKKEALQTRQLASLIMGISLKNICN